MGEKNLQQTGRRIARMTFIGLLCLTWLAGCKSQGEMTITDVTPRKATTQGGQKVVINGKHFRTDIGYTIYFGPKRAPTVTIIDENTLLVETPAHDTASDVDMTVRADNGEAFKISKVFSFEELQPQSPAKPGNLKF